jgi:hypothetical protein
MLEVEIGQGRKLSRVTPDIREKMEEVYRELSLLEPGFVHNNSVDLRKFVLKEFLPAEIDVNLKFFSGFVPIGGPRQQSSAVERRPHFS